MIKFHRRVTTSEIENERGASLVEYALLLALIAVVCVGAVTSLGGTVSSALADGAAATCDSLIQDRSDHVQDRTDRINSGNWYGGSNSAMRAEWRDQRDSLNNQISDRNC